MDRGQVTVPATDRRPGGFDDHDIGHVRRVGGGGCLG
jgi:hypothetical protein